MIDNRRQKGKRGGASEAITRRVWALVATAAIVAVSAVLAFPPQEKINQGLDIQGGLSVVLAAKPSDGQSVTAEQMDKAKSIIESRVNALGASEASVQIQGQDQILVQIPGATDSSSVLDSIGRTGVLEFTRLDSFTDSDVQQKIESGQVYETDLSSFVSKGDAPTGALALAGEAAKKRITVPSGTYEPLFSGEHILQVSIGRESDTSSNYAVNLRLDGTASDAFAKASTELYPSHGQVVILLDGEVQSAPAIQSPITGGEVSITGGFDLDEARALQTVLDSGSLPVSFEYEQAQLVGPTLGQGELSAGLLSMLLGIVMVIVYMLAFYRGFGLVPAANMIVFSVIYLGALALLSRVGLFSLSLAGLAGVILSVGMTADSVVLAIEKFKEELKCGRTVKAASEKGVRHAIVTSLDADAVSLITALSLFFLATSSIKGFGLTLAIGIVCDILVMLLFVAPLIRLLAPSAMRRHPGFWGIAYAELLGDVRTGSSNYELPSVAKERADAAKAERKERKRAERKREKERRGEVVASNAKAKELRRESKQAEKEAKRELLEEIRAQDALRDEARKEARRVARQEKKEEKSGKRNMENVFVDGTDVLEDDAVQETGSASDEMRTPEEISEILATSVFSEGSGDALEDEVENEETGENEPQDEPENGDVDKTVEDDKDGKEPDER